jgi:hypothetical protein
MHHENNSLELVSVMKAGGVFEPAGWIYAAIFVIGSLLVILEALSALHK